MSESKYSNTRRGVIAALICNTIYGLSFMFSKVALEVTSPSILLVLRFAVALLVMLALVVFRISKLDLRGKPIVPLLLLGLCQPVVYFIFESYGIKYTNASFSGLMIAIIPVMSAIFSAIFLKEELRISKLLWIIGSVAGVVLISVTESSSGAIQFKGVLLMVGAVLSAAVFSILSKSLAEKFTAFERTFIMMVLGFVAFLIMAVVQEGAGLGTQLGLAMTNRSVLIPVLFLSILSSVVAFFCQNLTISELPVQRAMAFANLAPIVSVIAGVAVLHEPFSLIHLVGIVVILVCIYMVNRVSED